MKVRRPIIKHPRRLIIIILSIVFVGALAIYGVLSYNAWRAVADYGQTASGAMKQAVDTQLGDPQETTSRERIEAALSHFRAEYKAEGCDVTSLYHWQTVIPAVKQLVTDCEEHTAAATTVVATLEDLIVFYKDQEAAATLLNETISSTKDSKDYAAVSATWNTALTAPALTEVSDSFRPVAERVIEVTQTLQQAYVNLVTANKNENKAELDDAIAKIKAAHARIGEIQVVADTELQKLVDAFLERYSALNRG